MKLVDFINSSDECQFTIEDFVHAMGDGDIYTGQMLKRKLIEHYKDALWISNVEGKVDIYNFTGMSKATLYEKWYSERKKSNADERIRIVETAAAIIREDIRSRIYSDSEYPASDTDLDDRTLLPKSLQSLLNGVMISKSASNDWKKAAIGQAIISACRPRSFVSPILLSVGVYAHRNFASRELVTKLSKLSFSVDYAEVKRQVF